MRAKIFNYTFNLDLCENITMIIGDSGVGKSLIYEYLKAQSFDNENIHCYNAEKISDLRKDKQSFIDKIKTHKNSLIVIDNADTILDLNTRKFIGFDTQRGNKYIIFGRNGEWLWVTEDNIAELVRNDKTKEFKLNYLFKGVNSL